MFLQRYVHVVLDAVLGSYVKNIDPATLQISIWNGKLEVEALEFQPDAFFFFSSEFRLLKGTLRQLRIDLPWTNLANEPIRVDIQDVSILFQVDPKDRTVSEEVENSREEQQELLRKKLQSLQRKRAAIDAMEKATAFNEQNNTQARADQSWTQSFLFKLLVKVLDNVQVHIQHLHVRMEDLISDSRHPYAVGMTLEAIIIKSADEGWNFTMVGRGTTQQQQEEEDDVSFIRKKMDINKFGIYWALPLIPTPVAVLNDADAFATLMKSSFDESVEKKTKKMQASSLHDRMLSPPMDCIETENITLPRLFKSTDYIVHPLTVSMKLTVNDGNAKLPLTHYELSERVLSRLGTPWMVDTIDAIGDDAWNEFVNTMPKLAGERKYTLGFVFSEAWSVARDRTEEEDEIPSVLQFKEALSSCMQWSLEEVDRVEHCIVKYREAVVHVMEEKSTYVDVQASIDQISTSLHRQQYLSALSFISFLTVKRRQTRYLDLRPKRIHVKDNPGAWWRYAINAVLLDVRERLAHVDWAALEIARQRRNRYKTLCLMLEHGTSCPAALVPPDLRLFSKEMARNELAELELVMDVQELVKLRRAVRKEAADKEKEKQVMSKHQSQRSERDVDSGGQSAQSSSIRDSSRLWSYATWLTGAGGPAHGGSSGYATGGVRGEDMKWSDQDTKDLYDAIDFHPEEDKENRPLDSGETDNPAARKKHLHDHQHILYRFQLTLCRASFGLSLEDVPANVSSLTVHDGASQTNIPSKSSSSSYLIASLDDVDIQFLVRPSCREMSLQLRDAFFCQGTVHDGLSQRKRSMSSPGTDFYLQRMDMDEVLKYHPIGVRNQMSSVRLRRCERELPLVQFSIESEQQQKDETILRSQRNSEDDELDKADATPAAHLLRVSFMTQPIKCNVTVMFLLDVMAVFSSPVNVDLSGLEHSAWRRAQSLQRYSSAQLQDALARRTTVEMRLDVISPLINIMQSPPPETGVSTGNEVSLLVFLGHLKAQTKHPSNSLVEKMGDFDNHEDETIASRMIVLAPSEESLYDALEISISGIEVQVIDGGISIKGKRVSRPRCNPSKKSARHYLLNKTSLKFSFYISVAPDDPSIPLLKLFGGVDNVNLNLSATSFRSLMQLLHSFGENFSFHARRRIDRDIATAVDARSHPSRIGSLAKDTLRRSKPKLVRKSSSYTNKPGGVALSSSGSGGGATAGSEKSLYMGLAQKNQFERQKALHEEDIDDNDLLKLWKRVVCQLQFGIGEIVLTLQVRDLESGSGKIVRARAVDINTRLKTRSYDRWIDFALGTFLVEDILLLRSSPTSEVVEKKRFLIKSGNHGTMTDQEENTEERTIVSVKTPLSAEQLIHVAITSIASDAVMLKDKKLWKHARHAPLSSSSIKSSVWQDPLITTLSVDASLRVLTIDVYQDTLAEVFVFFFQRSREEGSVIEQTLSPPPPSLRSISEESTGSKSRLATDMEEQSIFASVDTDTSEGSFSKKIGVWVTSSFLDSQPSIGLEKENDQETAEKDSGDDIVEKPATMQFRLHVEGLSLLLHLDDILRLDGMPSAFASLTAQQFCCCVQQFPRYLGMFATLTSLKICDVSLQDQHLSEIVSHGSTFAEPNDDKSWMNRNFACKCDGDIAVGHVPTLAEILNLLDAIPAVFSCAMQFYGTDSIQEVWHPGYTSRCSVRLKSPRIRFLYSFVDDMRNYWMKGVLLKTVLSILSREQADTLWEGDFQLADTRDGLAESQLNEKKEDAEEKTSSRKYLGSDVVSVFPLVDIRLEDAILEMPPHRMSSESLLLRFDTFRVSNEGVVSSFLGMENRIIAKVLLNSSLKQLQLDMKALRIVSVILVDRSDVGNGGFVTQSLLGLTNYSLSVDFRSHAELKLSIGYSPVRLVCNQEQYAFVLRVPLQNYHERTRYRFVQAAAVPTKVVARVSSHCFSLSQSLDESSYLSRKPVADGDEVSNGTSASEVPESTQEYHIMLDLRIPEVTLEILQGQHGYHLSSSGDLDMAEKGKTHEGSICVLTFSLLSGRADYNLANGRLTADIDLEGVHIRDSRVNSKMSASYRNVVVFERCTEGLPKAIKIQFGRESISVDVSKIGFEPAFTTHRYGLQRSRMQFRSVSSRTFVGLFGSELLLKRTDSDMSAYSAVSSTGPSDSRENKPSPVVGVEERMEFVIDVAGFKVIPSNIHYDVVQFLTTPPGWSADDNHSSNGQDTDGNGTTSSEETIALPTYRRIGLELHVGPSALLVVEDPHKLKSRALMLSWESSIAVNYLRQTNEDECPDIEDIGKKSPALSQNQMQLCVTLENIHATSRLSKESVWGEQAATAASADCLKSIDMEIVVQIDLRSRFLRFQTTFNRVMELRFGYLDFCTMLAAVEHILRRSFATKSDVQVDQKGQSTSGSSISSLSGRGADSETSSWSGQRRSPSFPRSSLAMSRSKRSERQRTAALYGTTLIYLVSASFRGRLETRPVVGFYNSTWRKRYLVLPFTTQQRQLVQSVAFRIIPAPDSRRQIGDEIYYGDRIVLEAVVDIKEEDNNKMSSDTMLPHKEAVDSEPVANKDAESTTRQSTLIRKYDQLGAIGYLGPEGSAGVFETTIWKHGSTMFNSDKSVIYDRELIVFEELTIYRSFSESKTFGTASDAGQQMDFNSSRSGPQAEGAHTVDTTGARGGGYLMFNGVGDAPIPFALSIVSSRCRPGSPKENVDIANGTPGSATNASSSADTSEETPTVPARKRKKRHKSLFAYASFLENLKILELTLPGVNATVVNDFHNMLLPLLHFRVAALHADVRGRLDDKFTALSSLRFGIQAYNSQLAVWEPVLEDFEVNMAYHGMGGVLCDYCMSERQSISPTGAALRCDGMPLCLFRSSRTEVFTNAAAHSWESKNFIYRELLQQPDVQDGAKFANSFMVVVKDDFNINVSRNVINVLVHFFALVTKVTAADEALASRLGPYIYVDNQSGIPFVVATHPSSAGAPHTSGGTPSSSRRATGSIEMPTEVPGADTNEEIMKAGTAMFNSTAWSRRRLSTMLNDISSSNTKWIRVESGERIATEIVAHEAPAGCVTSPLRRLLWLKPQSYLQMTTSSKAIPVPIGYSNRSYLHLESGGKQRDSWHGKSIICETVAEQGTLVLRLRGKVQLTNFFSAPIQVIYNDQRKETIEPGGVAAHYIPIQYLESGSIAFCPLLSNGKVQTSDSLSIASLLRSNDSKSYSRSNRRQNVGSLELRKALTFYWDVHPNTGVDDAADCTFDVSLPPFQVILTALRKSERHETTITLRPPIVLENLVPYEMSYRTVCMKSEVEVVWVTKNAASFSGANGKVPSGSTACVAELDILEQDMDSGEIIQTPTVVGLSLALPQIELRRFSRWSRDTFVYGCQSFCERIELNMRDDSELEAPTPANKLTICVEIVQLEKLRSRSLNKLCPVVCRLFAEYWLIDRTSLSLAFYTADDYLIPSNHPSRPYDDIGDADDKSSAVSLSVFSCESKQIVSKMKIGIKSDVGEREVQSELFDISAVGVRGQILVPTNRSRDARSLLSTIAEFGAPPDGQNSNFKQYEFGVMIEQGPEKFSRSRVVTLVPRYYFVNTSSQFDIHVRQERLTDPNAVIVLQPKETKVFHWSDSRLPLRVQICFVLPDKRHDVHDTVSFVNSSQWSAPFELSSVGNFVLRVKSKVRPAPPCFPGCSEGGIFKHKKIGEAKEASTFFNEEDENNDADWMLTEEIQLNVAVELHDPTFLVYLEEGSPTVYFSSPSLYAYEESDREHTLIVKQKENEGFVPFKIKNECSNLALIVWQKTLVKNDKGNMTVGFEGGEPVLPFHSVDYVPFRFSAFPTVFVQVQKVAGLGVGALRKEHLLRGRQKKTDKRNSMSSTYQGDNKPPIIALSRAAAVGQAQVVASFEVQLKKLQRLPTIDVSEGAAKKRLWAEVLLDQTTKTLLVTDMLPGFSGEHKRRRRATLLRSWKRYNTSIVFISHVLSARNKVCMADGSDDDTVEEAPAKKKRVRFAADVSMTVKENLDMDEDKTHGATKQGDEAGTITLSVAEEKAVEALALCVRLVEATHLEEVFLQAGRSDLTSCQPFITFSLKTSEEETRTKLTPQATTMFPRWLPASDSRVVLSSLMLSDDDMKQNETSCYEFGIDAEIIVEIREADKILFGSSVIATTRIPLQEYCAAAMISSRSDANYETSVVEFLAPVHLARKSGVCSRFLENEARIRFQICCQRTFATRCDVAEFSGEGRDNLDVVKALKDKLSAYQLKRELDVLVSSKSQLKLLLEHEAVDTSTSGTNIPAALRSVPDYSLDESKKSTLTNFVARSARTDEDITGDSSRSVDSAQGAAVSATTDESTSDDTYEEMGDEKRLTAVLIGVSNLQIPTDVIQHNFKHTHGTSSHLEPKVYCTITYQESTRSALSAIAKSSGTSSMEQIRSDDHGSTSPARASMAAPLGNHAHLQQIRTHEFQRGQLLGLDLVYRNGRVLVQGVVCDGPCGTLVYEGKIRIGDTVVAANNKSIVNLHRDASFAVIEKAMHWGEGVGAQTPEQTSGSTFTLSFLYQPPPIERMTFSNTRPPCAQTSDEDTGVRKYDAEWNRRVEFAETTNTQPAAESDDEQVHVRVYLRNETSDHGLSASQESSIVPFLYFFGDDAMMDHLDHSKQDSRFDVLLAECWVPLPPSSLLNAGNPMSLDGNPMAEPSALTFNERICALYSPQQRSHRHSALKIIGQLRLALKWDFINSLRAAHQQEDLSLHFQLEVARICISVVDDGAWSAVASATGLQQPKEVLCISLSDQNASAGIQLSYGQISDGKKVINARVGHFQIDNQLLDTNYPVLLHPMRLLDAQMQEEGHTLARDKGGKADTDADSLMLLPTLQLMAVFSLQQNVVQFDYIFGQLQELEIKLEDATLVALANVFSGVEWSHTAPNKHTSKRKKRSGDELSSNLALELLKIEWSTPTLLSAAAGGRLGSSRSNGGANMKVLLRWLLLCPVKVNVTITSTADRSLLLSLLSPDMSSVLSTLITAAATLVSNLDQAPIRIPEFYVENLLETTHTLAFYAMQHYIHHGLRSWYSIMGSVDFLGNPIGLVSTLGTGVKDFFYTPAQMLLEDENGLRIDNLRTGMTKGSKSLLRNTAVGIFHTTGKITETLGKGLALLAMDEQYNVQRQRASTRQIKKINDLGDAIAEGSKGFVGGVWDGIKGVVAAPVHGAEQDGAGGFVVGIGKGVAGLIVKPTAGFLDLLTSLSRGAKTSAESLDGTDRNAFDAVTRFRLPRRICSDGVLVSYSEREARGYAVLLLTSLDATDDYVYHVDYGIEPHRGLLLLTDKRLICLSGKTGQKLWEVALDSTLEVVVENATLKISQTTSPFRSYSIECDNDVAATNFRVAVDSARVDVSATRYLLLNLEKSQEESRIAGGGRFGSRATGLFNNEEDRTDLHVLMENVQDTTVSGISNDDLRSQPLRSVRVEVCHLQNKDAHANVPNRAIDKVLSFSVFQIQVYGGPYHWTVFRRFSEFRELCADLESAGYVLDGLPPLPPRTFLPSTRAPVAKHRQEALNIFLQAAIMHSAISRSAAMLDFLTRGDREVRVSLPPLSPTGEREASQRAGDSP